MSHVELPPYLTGYQDLTVGSTAVKLTPPVADPALPATSRAVVQVQRASVRVRFDGGTPSTNSGFIAAIGDSIEVGFDVIANAKWLADTNTASLLSISYFA